jgi:hypothetical protein
MRNARWTRALLVGIGLALMLPGLAQARRDPPSMGPRPRIDEFAGWFHDAGNILLHVSNQGRFGRAGQDATNPSREWPAGSNEEYLFGAGLWVAGVIQRGGGRDTLCSAGLYQIGEYRNLEPDEGCGDPIEGICETFEGAPRGLRRFDDDGDGLIDEDALDGQDNDGDGREDEDFAGISQQMYRSVYYDTTTFFNQFFSDPADRHTPMGLMVIQESYAWTDPNFDDFVGIEFKIKNISRTIDPAQVGWPINNAYIGFMVDGDVGVELPEGQDYWTDDQGGYAELDTTITTEGGGEPIDLSLTLGYIYDQNGGEDADDDVTGYCGVMFLGHTTDVDTTDGEILAPSSVGIHAFRIWSGGDEDDRDDLDRYRFLRGTSDVLQTISQNTTRANDYRFLVSAGPFAQIPPETTLTFQVAFVCGDMVERTTMENGQVVTRRLPDFTNPIQAQRVYNGFVDPADGSVVHWATSSPPPPPQVRVTAGDRNVVIEWDDFPEHIPDPLTRIEDFAGYQVWKAEGWRRESNIPSDEMWRLIADYDTTELADIDTGISGVGKYRTVDTRVQNGFWYWYAVTAYDEGTFRIVSIDSTGAPPETTRARVEEPKFGKYTQTMRPVMAGTTPTQTLDDVYVVPNPYRANAAWDLAETSFEPTGRRIRFYNLPPVATIRIYTLAGDHVITLEHNEALRRAEMESGEFAELTSWNLISQNQQDTVSEIYIYHVETPDGQEKIGKFVVIR